MCHLFKSFLGIFGFVVGDESVALGPTGFLINQETTFSNSVTTGFKRQGNF